MRVSWGRSHRSHSTSYSGEDRDNDGIEKLIGVNMSMGQKLGVTIIRSKLECLISKLAGENSMVSANEKNKNRN